ncbi:MAG: glycosyltransferase family 4 protein [Leptolyngbyaceae cyanobacterium bins.349]|nr:glycosyltransferase family 4 protein [Leptolyngbyaceae cyanobacterium bins.349]
MNICLVTQTVAKGNGQGRVNYEITLGAIQRGHRITLLSTSIAPELQNHHQIEWIPISVKGWRTQLLRDLAFAYHSARWLKQHRLELDLVAVNGGITWERGEVNMVHFVHSAWLQSSVHISRLRRDFYGMYHRVYSFLHSRWERKVCREVNRVIAVSQKVGKELAAIGVPQERIQVIINGVDLQEFSPGKISRNQLGLPEEIPIAFFAGDIGNPRKNLDTILYALQRVPEVHLVVLGSTEGSPYPFLASQLEISERVHFLGYRKDVADLMRSSDMLVFPSRYEACTLVILEAMASGLPIITAETTGGCELVTPDCGVVLADSEDVEALACALAKLANDRLLRLEMGRKARAIAEKYSWESMAQSYIMLFEELNPCKL